MRPECVVLFLLLLTSSIPTSARQASQTASAPAPIQRDLQALAIVQKAIAAMGATVPADSLSTGTVTITAGGTTDQGTIRLLTRGTQQTFEEVQTPPGTHTVIFSNGEATESINGAATPSPLQRMVTSQCPYFPLPYLASLLANPDEAFAYVGIENVSGSPAAHIRATNTYSSTPIVQFLTEFTTTDLWFDAQTALPVQVAYVRRDTGLSPKIPMEVQFSGYKSAGGSLYPATIQVLMNGTQWMTISVQTFQTNLGMTDADFPVVEYQP